MEKVFQEGSSPVLGTWHKPYPRQAGLSEGLGKEAEQSWQDFCYSLASLVTNSRDILANFATPWGVKWGSSDEDPMRSQKRSRWTWGSQECRVCSPNPSDLWVSFIASCVCHGMVAVKSPGCFWVHGRSAVKAERFDCCVYQNPGLKSLSLVCSVLVTFLQASQMVSCPARLSSAPHICAASLLLPFFQRRSCPLMKTCLQISEFKKKNPHCLLLFCPVCWDLRSFGVYILH